MRTAPAERVVAAAVAMLERHHAGQEVHRLSLEWARFIVAANEDYPRQVIRPAGTWERTNAGAMLRPADPFDGLAA